MVADDEEKQPFIVEMGRRGTMVRGSAPTITHPDSEPKHIPFAVIFPVWLRHAAMWFYAGGMWGVHVVEYTVRQRWMHRLITVDIPSHRSCITMACS